MASSSSLFLSLLSTSSCHIVSSLSTSCSPPKCLLPSPQFCILKLNQGKYNVRGQRRGALVPKFAVDGVSVVDPPPPPPPLPPPMDSGLITSLKLELLGAVSGLNRGLAANEDDLRKADAAAKDLEAAGGSVDLSADLEKLQGRWKLIYSSAFSFRTLGGSRPGPPTGRLLPITLGQVFQRIDVVNKDFDNIVELQLGTPWPFPPIESTATLEHKFELIGIIKMRRKACIHIDG